MDTVLGVSIICAVIAGVGIVFAIGVYRMRRLVSGERDMIMADAVAEGSAAGGRPSETQMERLPDPVRRYLHKAGAMRDPPARFIHLRQTGEFRISRKSGWSKMRAEQWFNALSPEFVWHATVKPFPLFWVEGRDSLVRGKGSMIIRLLSVITVVDARGKEMDVSSIVRYLSEMPWFPSSLLPSECLRWERVGDKAARATLVHGGLSVSMTFTFNDEDEIMEGYSEDRFVEDRLKQPWIVRYGAYREIEGFRIPTDGNASWKTKDGEFTYVKVRVTDMDRGTQRP